MAKGKTTSMDDGGQGTNWYAAVIAHGFSASLAVLATLVLLDQTDMLGPKPRVVVFDEVEAILSFSEDLPEGLAEAEFKAAVLRFQTNLPFLIEDYASIHRVAVFRRDALAGHAPDISRAIARMGQS